MNTNETPGAEPPRSASSPSEAGNLLQPKRLYRDPSGPIGGVASGFAGYFNVDPVITRLLWMVALFSGIGFPAYLVCWLVIPKAKVWPPPGYGGVAAGAMPPNQTALISGFVILGLVAVIGTGVDGLGQYLLPAALVGIGVYLLSQRGEPAAAGALDAGAPGAGGPAAGAGDPAAGGVAGVASTELASWQRSSGSARPERTGLVTPTVLSLLAIGAGVIAALHAADLVHLSVGTLAAGGLVVVGGGLLASLWLGRARGLVPLGLILVCVMLVAPSVESWASTASKAHVEVRDLMKGSPNEGAGTVSHAPRTLEELQPHYDLGVGDLTLDLSALDFSQDVREVSVNLGIGEVLVLVSQDAPVEVRGEVGIGEARALGNSKEGLGASLRTDAAPPGSGKLVLNVNVAIGEAEVRRAP